MSGNFNWIIPETLSDMMLGNLSDIIRHDVPLGNYTWIIPETLQIIRHLLKLNKAPLHCEEEK